MSAELDMGNLTRFVARSAMLVAGAALALACSSSKDDSPPAAPSKAYAPAPAGFTENPPVQATVGAGGGTLTLQDGATLEIPPGALDQDTQITAQLVTRGDGQGREFRYYQLEPSGLVFHTPATLRMKFRQEDLENARVVIRSYSDLHELQTDGLEQSRFRDAEFVPGPPPPGELAVSVPHFTFFLAGIAVDARIHMVTDVPAKYLLPGDMLFTLTHIGGGPDWGPGHVAVFTGGRTAACKPEYSDAIIEATSPAVRTSHLDDEVTDKVDGDGNPYQDVKKGLRTESEHFYLGARRPEQGLTGADRGTMVFALNQYVGAPYNLAGGPLTLYKSFSCVGLAETALDLVGKGPLGAVRQGLVSVPLELYEGLVPVRDATVYVGDTFEMPVYGTVVHPASGRLYVRSGAFCARQPCCDGSTCNAYTIEASNLPPGATFEEVSPGRYVFRWTPTAEHAGKSYAVGFRMKAPSIQVKGLIWGHDEIGPAEEGDTFRIMVEPCDAPPPPPPSCADPAPPAADKVACVAGGDDTRTALDAAEEALPSGGTHGNSNLSVPAANIEGNVDLTGFAMALTGMTAQELNEWTAFTCGFGFASPMSVAMLCPPNATPPQPGDYVVVRTKLKDPVPQADPVKHFQYGFVFDSDGDPSNNYKAQSPYLGDFFDNTDRWYEADYDPSGGWKMKVSTANASDVVTPATSAARIFIRDNVMELVVPKSELPGPMAGARTTTFSHNGDYGQNPPNIYSADMHHEVGTPLIKVP